MSQETRTVRPYMGLRELDRSLDEALLHFGLVSCQANRSVHVDLQPHEFLLRPVSLDWASDDEAFTRFRQTVADGAQRAGYDLNDLAIVVIASSSFLKLAEVVFRHPVSDISGLPRSIDLADGARPSAFSAPFSGFAVDAYVLLVRQIDRRQLRPHRKGTWLAHANFRVDTSLTAATLPPTPLDGDTRRALKLPAKTMRYISFGSHDPLAPYRDQEQPVLYVDAELLAQLNARRSSVTSRAFQRQLVCDFVSAIVWKASRSEEMGSVAYEDVRTSLIGSIIRMAAGPGATEADRKLLLSHVRDRPEYVIAIAEHSIDVISTFSSAAKDGES